MKPSILVTLILFSCFTTQAQPEHQTLKECFINQMMDGDQEQTIAEAKEKCRQLNPKNKLTALEKRQARELLSSKNPNVITPHKRNYILPLSYLSSANDLITEEEIVELDALEAKFQFSMKVPVFEGFSDPDQAVYFAFTLKSFWQVYNSDISAPFRETNYEPELFWINRLDPDNLLWGDAMAVALGIVHESNGRSNTLSRSWNRIYANFIWEQDGFVLSFKPWYRIPEDEKTSPFAAEGDDNPDIHKYLGYFEFSGIYRFEESGYGLLSDSEFSFMARNNLNSDNRGAIELNWSFPLWGRLRGYTQYFNGYGESLIDYNASVERFGVGILLTDLL